MLQQHGTVYWGKGGRNHLKTLNPEKFLHEQLAMSFSINLSPIWMDSTTTKECKMLEDIVGGPEVLTHYNLCIVYFCSLSNNLIGMNCASQKLAELTGSRAYERFSGSQIAKIAVAKPEAYANTEV